MLLTPFLLASVGRSSRASLLTHAKGACVATQQTLASYSSSSSSDDDNDGYPHPSGKRMHATTILCIRRGDQVVLIGDGQVSMGSTVVKPNARKVRRIGDGVVVGFAGWLLLVKEVHGTGKFLLFGAPLVSHLTVTHPVRILCSCGYPGSAADGLSLMERLEMKLEEHPGQLLRASVELAKQWRQDKALRNLQAELLVADATTTLAVSGNGDVLEPHDGVMAIGSGGNFAVAAARALMDNTTLDALTIGKKSMEIASDMCIYTNKNFVWETIVATQAADTTVVAAESAKHSS